MRPLVDSLEVIGKIELNKDVVNIYVPTNVYLLKTEIIEINITVREGIILEIIAKTKDGIFRNKTGIIDLLHLGEFTKKAKLYLEHQDYKSSRYDNSYVYLDDVIKYSAIRSYSDVAYGDFDIELLPNDESRTYLLRESTSINTYFDVAAFTDLRGLGGEPNGLAQFVAEAKFITNTKTKDSSSSVWFNHLSFRGGVSKFDNDFKGTQLNQKDTTVNRKDLLQRSIYSIGAKLNLIRGFNSPAPKHLFSDLQLNVGYNFVGSKIYDTTMKGSDVDTTFKTITQNQFYIEPLAVINRHRNFALTLSMPLSAVSIKKSAEINNDAWEYWIRPSISLMYYGKRDPSSKIFFRYNHHINLGDPKQAFAQMQLGFAVNLTEVWGNKDK